jgi:hypothetical protein
VILKIMLLGIASSMQQCSLMCLSCGTCTIVYRCTLIASSEQRELSHVLVITLVALLLLRVLQACFTTAKRTGA